MRIGYGEDLHALVRGRPLRIGGVVVPADKGEQAHSDGDVLIHAIADALYGAIGSRDIGYHFPDNDPGCLNLKGEVIAHHAVGLVRKAGYEIGNLDCTVFLQQPKLSRLIPQIRSSLASILELNVKRISVKAKTNEGFDAVGEGKAIRAVAVVLLEKENEK